MYMLRRCHLDPVTGRIEKSAGGEGVTLNSKEYLFCLRDPAAWLVGYDRRISSYSFYILLINCHWIKTCERQALAQVVREYHFIERLNRCDGKVTPFPTTKKDAHDLLCHCVRLTYAICPGGAYIKINLNDYICLCCCALVRPFCTSLIIQLCFWL